MYIYEAFVCRPLGFIRKDKIDVDLPRALKSINEFLGNTADTIDFTYNGKKISINIMDIMYIEVYGHYVYIKCVSQGIEVRENLVTLEKKIKDYNFVRINRNIIVNLKYVEKIEDKKCCLKDSKALDVSCRNYKNVYNEWRRYC